MDMYVFYLKSILLRQIFLSTGWQESHWNDAIGCCGLCYRNYIVAYN